MNELKIFENPEMGSVRVQMDANGEPWFCAADVCAALGYANARKAIADHVSEEDVTKRYAWVVTGQTADGEEARRNTYMSFINESGVYSLIFSSKLEQAEKFKRWVTKEVLPSIRKTGSYSTNYQQSQIQAEMQVASWVIEQLRLSDGSKLHMVKQITDKVGLTLPGEMAKGYVPSKGEKKSATELLKQFNIPMSAVKFNQLAAKAGVLEQLTRKGSKGKIHKWWSIKENWLEYGENDVNEKNPLETTAHWYSDKFKQLVSLICTDWSQYA